MATKIEWTNETLNPIRARRRSTGRVGWHCVHVSPGCENCYSETMNRRIGTGLPFKPGHLDDGTVELFLDPKMLAKPLRWRRPRMIFVCSMTDLFGEFVPDEWIDQICAVMALCPQHTFQVLTKRTARMRAYMTTPNRKRIIAEQVMAISELLARQARSSTARIKLDYFSARFDGTGPFPNVWLGTSAEDQRRADLRLPDLLDTPAALRFVSYEPALEAVDFTDIGASRMPWHPPGPSECLTLDALKGRVGHLQHGRVAATDDCARIDWLICGGESGHTGARPMNVQWARQARDQCADAGVAFYMKQLGRTWYEDGASGGRRRIIPNHPKGGDPAEWPDDLRVRQFPTERAT